MRVLEVGPDGFPSTYQKLVADPSIRWDTIDIYDSDKLTYRAASEYSFPIADGMYDIVLSGQVIEHVKKIWRWMNELARVCKPGGLVITINPVSWPFHEYPVDCWRIFPDGMRALYEDAGLTTRLAVFENLADSVDTPTKFYLFKQGIKAVLGKKPRYPWTTQPVIDTISIAVKD